MRRKRDRLFLISPDGTKYEIGFLSRCKDGIVLGVTEIEGVETSHLTIVSKKSKISAHITSQNSNKDRRFFPPISKKEIMKKIKPMIEKDIIHPLTPAQTSENVLYITQRLLDWLDSLKDSLYQKETLPNGTIHKLDFQRLMKRLPFLIDEFKQSPQSFLGLCKAYEMLTDQSKVLGLNDSKILIIPHEGRLYGINLSLFLGFSFDPTLNQEEISGPLSEISHGLGIPQYITEVQNRKFFQKLLSK